MGRNPLEIDINEVERLAGQGLTHIQIAKALGISHDTLYSRKKKYSDFSDAIDRGQAKGIDTITNALFENATEGNHQAQIFYLKNRAGWSDKQELAIGKIPDGLDISFCGDDAKKED